MSNERNLLEARAARHAALSDAARLRIVDLLTLGDLSPSELQGRLGMPSNLIAHHLGVLERESLITRTRSEADRRRSYVHLEFGALGQLDPPTRTSVRRLLFVCTANSARSQLAAQLWAARSDIPAASAGTHPADQIAPGAVAVARRRGLTLPLHAPAHITAVAEEADFIITVCDAAHEEMQTDALHWSIADPVAKGTDAAFDAAFDELAERVHDLAQRLTAS